MTPQIFCRHHIQEQIQIDTETRIKNSKVNELFDSMKRRNIYLLCGPFKTLSEIDAEDRFSTIIRDSTVNIDIPIDIKKYLQNLLSENIEMCVVENRKTA
ncbi:unnamed protein product [Rhizophagus irregularis]|nr:unnamed protein product [Rhizophagus irregularis]